ncbi:hypothetical protein [Corallococcus aberystwythensis]|uniref:hypothetical protein n=1 Tax=Corallococcus aberystwythensis TaxID=2316722 RepID=UPI0011C42C36|nr:hypothetical protein [Corallococcus aberystwythensis]
MSMKSVQDIQGYEFDWPACDDAGHVGFFSTAGGGYVPSKVLLDTDALDAAIHDILASAVSSGVRSAPISMAGPMLTVHVDPNTLAMSASGMISGVILLRGEESSFPDDAWNDAPVVLLKWWLEELTGLQSGHAATACCHFMDGPFSFDVSLSDGEFMLRCQRQRQHATQVVLESRVPSAVFMEVLVAAAHQVVDGALHHR